MAARGFEFYLRMLKVSLIHSIVRDTLEDRTFIPARRCNILDLIFLNWLTLARQVDLPHSHATRTQAASWTGSGTEHSLLLTRPQSSSYIRYSAGRGGYRERERLPLPNDKKSSSSASSAAASLRSPHLVQKFLIGRSYEIQLSWLCAVNTKIAPGIYLDHCQSTPFVVHFTSVAWWPKTSSPQCKTFWKHYLSRITVLRRLLVFYSGL